MAAAPTPPSTGYARQLPIKPAPWHALVGFDVLFNGLTTGLFLVAAVCELAWPANFSRVARIAYVVALVFLAFDLLMLVLDLGDPKRFHHMLRIFKPTSPMSLGVWSLTAYSLPLTIAAVLSFFPDEGAIRVIRLSAVALGLVPALASAVYKGVLFSTSAQPAWRDGRWLGGYLTGGAVLLGCAELILLALILAEQPALALLRVAFSILLVAQLIPSALLAIELRPSLIRAYSANTVVFALALLLVLGTIIPLFIVAVGIGPLWLATAAVLVVLANAAGRFVIVYLPHEITSR